ncbi:acyl-CoA synthase [Streptomyces alfalfae]|uniref:Acyl-CoA synthase n=1 Tax=Streptomyces alfalfae TaxID=1642299 RepID=A0A1P8TKU6_9ACTN|nr:SCP2 sterol-binding domain-containing protein [Streptomyces alfalfae]AYA18674.1 acyl-CoA synthase [Streptomyces fradiae]APY88277.1 acyl-CoA synthase [Streptomyces alfalfae]QQC89359.1 SCP2 sterol-binding domain-containing protein [Streptomyces alfalfae]QUI31810.1 SCP2 sterol-binding domain-containing protein [Streptomyces alfalfae]RXX46446.1 acyl-CoA synthase [Streptomyces alfalfae]
MAVTDGVRKIAGLDFASVTPEEFARLVKKLSDKEIAAIARDGALRPRVLREVFGRVERQFRPDAAGSLKALIRWRITGSGDNEDAVYETAIADGACAVREGRSDADPRLTLVLADPEFLKLVSGNVGPVKLFMLRKVKIVGDVALAACLTRYFDIPKA